MTCELEKKEAKLEKDLITKIVLGLILMWAFGFAWGILLIKWGVIVL
jgi:hypothetical protein